LRRGKGLRDRTVYLTTTATRALRAYLDARGLGSTDHVFLHRNAPLYKDLVRDRIKAAGARVGVKVSPHRLRHTFATQLVNAGCKITTIQKLLGHQRINSTLIYARVHDRTVAEDYANRDDWTPQWKSWSNGFPCPHRMRQNLTLNRRVSRQAKMLMCCWTSCARRTWTWKRVWRWSRNSTLSYKRLSRNRKWL